MLDPNPDTMNGEGYGIDEKKLAERISGWLEEAATNSQVDVTLYSIKENQDPIGPISLNQTVADRSDEIITIKTETIDETEVKYKNIDLLIQRDENSGLDILIGGSFGRVGSLYVRGPSVVGVNLY